METKEMPLLKVYAICFAAMVIGAAISPLIAVLIDMGVDSSVIAFYRLLFLSFMLCPLVFSKKKNRDNLKNADKKAWIGIIGYSVCKAIGLLLWAEAINAGGTSFLVGTLGNTSTIFIVLFTYLFLHEKTSKKSLLGIAVCLIGVCTVAISNVSEGFGGAAPVIIILLSAMFSSGSTLFAKQATKTVEFFPLITFGYALSCVFTGVVAAARGADFSIDLKSGLLMAVLGCVFTLISHSTPTWALKYAKPASVSVINLLSPFVTAAYAFVLLHQIPTLPTWIGAVIVAAGLFYYVNTEQKESIKVKD